MTNTHLKAANAVRVTDAAYVLKLLRQHGARRAWVIASATLYYRMCAVEGRRFDKEHNVETAEPARLSDLTIPEDGTVGFEYVATSPAVTRAALNSLPLEDDSYTFIDIGCGKGRAMIVAAELRRFKRIVGVELVPELVKRARSNLDACRSRFAPNVTAEVVCCDATKFSFPVEGLVLHYFAAPRDDNGVLRAVIEAVHRTRQISSKGAYVVVVNNHEDLSPTFPYLRRIPVKGIRATLYSSFFSLGIYRFC